MGSQVSAFNQRFTPKDWAGFPRAVGGGALMTLVFTVFSLIAPFALKFIAVPAALAALAFTVYAFWLGDDWEFRSVMGQASADRHGVTAETWTRD
jgi:uncharacterized membrane protein YccF (DUF307 family)